MKWPGVRGQVEADDRRRRPRARTRLVVAVARASRPRAPSNQLRQRLRVVRRDQRGDRHVAAREHRPAGLSVPAATSISNVCPSSPPARSGVKRPISRRVVRPRLGLGQRGDHALDGRHLDRRVGVPHLLVRRRALGGQLAEPGELQAVRRVVGAAVLDGLERDAPAAARVVGVGLGEPVAEQLARAALERLAVSRPRRSLVSKRSAPNARWNAGRSVTRSRRAGSLRYQ